MNMGIVADLLKWGYTWRVSERGKKIIGIIKIAFGVGIMALGLVVAIRPEPFLRYGYPGIFLFNALSGPGMLLLPSLSLKMSGLILSAVSAAGMAVNDSVSWWIGINTEALVDRGKKLENISKILNKYGMVGLFIWSMLPFPYDFVGLAAGYLGIPYWKYVIPTFLGKFVRFWLICIGAVQIVNARM